MLYVLGWGEEEGSSATQSRAEQSRTFSNTHIFKLYEQDHFFILFYKKKRRVPNRWVAASVQDVDQ